MSYAPTGADVRRAHDLARELYAVRRSVWVGQESATVVVDDVVLVLAGLTNSGIGDGEDVIVVRVIVPGVCVSGALKREPRRVQTT